MVVNMQKQGDISGNSNRGSTRRRFLKDMTLVGSTVALSTGCCHGMRKDMRMDRINTSKETLDFIDDSFVVDLHSHTSLKTYFFNYDFNRAYKSAKGTWPFTLRTNGPTLAAGGVNALMSINVAPKWNPAFTLKSSATRTSWSPTPWMRTPLVSSVILGSVSPLIERQPSR